MKHHTLTAIVGIALLGTVGIGTLSTAQDPVPVQRVTMKDGQMYALTGGSMALMKAEVELPQALRVMTNGTYTVKGGKVRSFKEGQSLGADGMLTSPDGSIVPVFDHVVMRAGQPRIMRDGNLSALSSAVTLADGTRITPDGFVEKQGRRLRLLDGQIFRLDGTKVPAKDTITLRNGKVTVQKDGSLLHVAPGRSLMMNDGTKVFGDGTVVLKDGTRKQLAEGEILTVEGVVTRR